MKIYTEEELQERLDANTCKVTQQILNKSYTEEEVKNLCISVFDDAIEPDDGFYKKYNCFTDWWIKNKKK